MSVATISLASASMDKLAEKDTLKKFVTIKNVKQICAQEDTQESADSSLSLEDANLANFVDSSMWRNVKSLEVTRTLKISRPF